MIRAFALVALFSACSPATRVDPDAGTWKRDWAADPAIVVTTAPGLLYALSDVHGAYDRAVELLTNAGLATVAADGTAAWTGGNAVLVVVGDLVDKGDKSVAVLDLFRQLEEAAPKAGGRVIVTLGNHEAEFLADPENHKADAFRAEIQGLSMTPEQFASVSTRWGQFLHRRPIGALVSGWFFAHAGHTKGRTVADISKDVSNAIDAGQWGADVLVGADSPLEAQDWWSNAALDANLAGLQAKHVVMGHDPNAFSERGLIGAHYAGRLVHIDCGMTPTVDDSKGRLLEITGAGTDHESATAVSHTGKRDPVSLTAP